MELILKQYDIPLLRFSATNDSSTPEIEVHWINEDQKPFYSIPYGIGMFNIYPFLYRPNKVE